MTRLTDKHRTYNIIRMYRDGHPSRTISGGLTLEQAQQHCRDPESSSRTCKNPNLRQITRHRGPWFDGYSEE